jgi:hypothetical protein
MKEYTTHDDHAYIHATDIDGVAMVCFNDLDRVEMGEYEIARWHGCMKSSSWRWGGITSLSLS